MMLVVAVVCGMAVASQAGQTTTSTQTTKSFEVLSVQGGQLVVRLPEGTRELTVPDDFRFTVDGKQLALAELRPGMKGTATITTRTTVTPVTVTEVKNGTVMQASGASVLVKTDEGFKNFTQGDLDKRGVKIVRDGKPVDLSSLRKDDRLTATIITSKPPHVLTEKEVNASLAAAPAAGAPAGSTAAATTGAGAGAAPAAPAARKLPKTASSWPLLGLASALMIVLALGLTLRRRFEV
jgi:LPXTG-motif cell wall-anchored protein